MGKYQLYLKQFEDNVEKIAVGMANKIKEYVSNSGAEGVILGMSGGIDCSVVARLCQLAELPVLLVLMPNGNSMHLAGDNMDAMKLINKFNFKFLNCPITHMNNSVINGINNIFNPNNLDKKIELSEMAKSNISPRLRMIVLYTLGQSYNYLAMGTGNLSEITMGYFTKWGDGASDFNPLGDFTKSEVRILAKYLEIPERIINKAPSGNLWEGQTDEDEMGITYKDLDIYILTGEGTPDVVEKIENTKKKVAHKNKPIPIIKKTDLF